MDYILAPFVLRLAAVCLRSWLNYIPGCKLADLVFIAYTRIIIPETINLQKTYLANVLQI